VFVTVLVCVDFGLLNLILAVIVDRACEARKEDQDLLLRDKTKRANDTKAKLMVICEAMDKDGSGCLSAAELKYGYDRNAEFQKILKLMDVDRSDIGTIYDMMDSDKSGDVSYLEFVDKLHKLKNQDHHTLTVFIKHHVSDIRSKVSEQLTLLKEELVNTIESHEEHLKDLACSFARLNERISPSVHANVVQDQGNAKVPPPKENHTVGVPPVAVLSSHLLAIQGDVREELEVLRQRVENDLAASMKAFAKRAEVRSKVHAGTALPPGHGAFDEPCPQEVPAPERRRYDEQDARNSPVPIRPREPRPQCSSACVAPPSRPYRIPMCCSQDAMVNAKSAPRESGNHLGSE